MLVSRHHRHDGTAWTAVLIAGLAVLIAACVAVTVVLTMAMLGDGSSLGR